MIDKTTNIESLHGEYLKSGQTIMVGGFGRGGVPFSVIESMADGDYENLLLIKNDANEPDLGIGKLIRRGMVRHLVATHIGLNPECVQMMNDGKITVEFVPQGIFAERIRCGGSGIDAFLSDIGLETTVAKDKERLTFKGKEYLVETALRGDVAILCADRVDTFGNCWWRGSNRNMNPLMGLACDRVIVEAKEIVPVGSIQPEDVHLPGVVVDAVVQAGPRSHVVTAANSAKGTES